MIMRCPKPGDPAIAISECSKHVWIVHLRIPAWCARKACSSASRIGAVDNVVEHLGMLIKHWVDETDRTFASLDSLFIDPRDERCEDRRRGAGASLQSEVASDIDGNVIADGCNIWNATPVTIIQSSSAVVLSVIVVRIRWIVILEVSGYRRGLVVCKMRRSVVTSKTAVMALNLTWDAKDVAETATTAKGTPIRMASWVNNSGLRLEDGLSRVHFCCTDVG